MLFLNVTNENALKLYHLADMHQAAKLKEKSIEFMKKYVFVKKAFPCPSIKLSILTFFLFSLVNSLKTLNLSLTTPNVWLKRAISLKTFSLIKESTLRSDSYCSSFLLLDYLEIVFFSLFFLIFRDFLVL